MANYGQNYRSIIEAANTLFPRKEFLTPPQVAELLSVDVRTVRRAVTRKINPLPKVMLSNTRYKVPVESLAQWLVQNEVRAR